MLNLLSSNLMFMLEQKVGETALPGITFYNKKSHILANQIHLVALDVLELAVCFAPTIQTVCIECVNAYAEYHVPVT